MKFSDLKPDEFKELVKTPGYSIVSNQILNDGLPILFMYREDPVEREDTGWRFLSGKEEQDYLDDPQNSRFIGLNTMANMDPTIVPHLKSRKGTQLDRESANEIFKPLEE